MAVAAALLLFSDAQHIGVVLCQIDSLDLRFVTLCVFAGRIDPTERNFRRCTAVCGDCVRLDASWAFRAGSECVCP